MRKRRIVAVAVAVAAAVVAALYATSWYKPDGGANGPRDWDQQPPVSSPPAVPEGYVAFRFSSSFTYVKDGSSIPMPQMPPEIEYDNRDPGRITQAQVALPAPHIDFKIIDPDDYHEGPTATVNGKRLNTSIYTLVIPNKIHVDIGELLPGKTVTLSGTLYVPVEVAEKVSLMEDMETIHQFVPDEPPQTDARIYFEPVTSVIPMSFRARLERWDGAKWVTVEKYSRDLRYYGKVWVRVFLETN